MPMDDQSLILNATIPVIQPLEKNDFWKTNAVIISSVSIGALIFYLVLQIFAS